MSEETTKYNKPVYKADNNYLKYILIAIAGIAIITVIALLVSKLSQNSGSNAQNPVMIDSLSVDTAACIPADTAVAVDYNETSEAYDDIQSSDPNELDFIGYVDGSSEIVGEIYKSDDGSVYGRYYYMHTMRKYGDKPSTYISLSGMLYDDGTLDMTGTFYNNDNSESINGTLYDSGDGSFSFDGTLTTYDGRECSITFHNR